MSRARAQGRGALIGVASPPAPRETAAIPARDADVLGEVVAAHLRVKAAAIVARDEEERGERKP
jgi:hypothetical protein